MVTEINGRLRYSFTSTELKKLYEKHGSMLLMSKAIGCSIETVRRLLKNAKIKTSSPGVRKQPRISKVHITSRVLQPLELEAEDFQPGDLIVSINDTTFSSDEEELTVLVGTTGKVRGYMGKFVSVVSRGRIGIIIQQDWRRV